MSIIGSRGLVEAKHTIYHVEFNLIIGYCDITRPILGQNEL